MKAEIF